MDRLIYTAMTGAKHVFNRQAGVSNNLANASTTGFRAQEHHFRAVDVQGKGAPTRAFVVDASVADTFDQGPMNHTGRALDIAVAGKGWISVEAPGGAEAFTRAGSLQLSPEGTLQTSSGLNVLGDGGPITVPPGSEVAISKDGMVNVITRVGGQLTSNPVGRLKLVNPAENTIERRGDGLFQVRGGEAPELDPTVRLATETLEGSNVNVVDSMVNLISLSRQFEMQVRMLQTADTNARQAGQVLTMNR